MGILRTDRVSGLGGANAITGSAKFFGSNYISVGKSSDFALGTGDWTVEYWAYPSSVVSYQRHFYLIGSSSGNIDGIFANSSGISFGRTNVWAPTQVTHVIERWNHYALVHDSTNMRLYINGTQVVTSTDNFGTDSEKELIIGYSNSTFGGNFDGYISNFRIENGFARYTSAFTPPNTRLTKTENTTFLGLQSSGNVLQEETGKVITLNRSSTDSTGPIASRFTPNSPVGFSTTTDVGTQFGSTFDGVTTFDSQAYFVPPGGNTRERNRGRGIFADGDQSTDIEFINIQSMGNSQVFGDSTTTMKQRTTVGSSTRAVTAGGFDSPAFTNIIDFITIANTANATDFGDLLTAKRNMGGAGNNTRGIYLGGGNPGNTNTIEFITIATAGNAQDFADATAAKSGVGSLASPTRACFGGGQDNTIEFVTIASQGTNASDFGDLISGTTEKPAGTSSSTRGLFICGESQPSGTRINTIQFITIASTGNSTDFGDHTDLRRSLGACNNSIRAVYGGGNTPSATVNSLSFVTIATTGNGQDFGDLLSARSTALTTTSDSHGGIE